MYDGDLEDALLNAATDPVLYKCVALLCSPTADFSPVLIAHYDRVLSHYDRVV